MKVFFKKHLLTIIGIPLGIIGGYIYYHFWGCANGCPIKSTAWKMMLYGALMGGLLFNIIESEVAKYKSRN